MQVRSSNFKIIAVIALVYSMSTVAQIIIPFAFWKNLNSVLVISDGTTYSFGSIGTSISTDKTFSISNTGTGAASNIAGAAFTNAAFTFKGGTYPGTGGTCGTTLSSTSSCTIVVTANSASTGTINDTVTINYRNPTTATLSATRPITATFVNTPTKLAWITTASFMKINDCNAITIQRQDAAGNPITIATATAITALLFNNGTNGTYFSNSGCTTTITTTSIA